MNSRRLMMRGTRVEDAETLIKWYAQPELMASVGYGEGLIVDLDTQKDRIHNQVVTERLMMLTLLDETPIGECHYNNIKNATCHIGIKICELSEQGKGYGKEGLQMLLAHLFGVLGMKSVFLDTLVENKVARGLYQSVGFVETGINKDCWTDQQGQKRSAVLMTINKEQFKKALNLPFKMV